MKKNLLFDGIIATDIEYIPDVFLNNAGKVSISGAQEKLFAVKEGKSFRLVKDGEQSHFIIKPRPNNPALINQSEMPQNEYLTMQIASVVYGLDTANVGLVTLKDKHQAYIVERFDIDGGLKLMQEDICSLLGRSVRTDGGDYKYKGNYLEIADVIKKVVPTWRFEMPKFVSLVIFNYLFCNGDAHLKNFSVIKKDKDVFSLAPAYDLINTSLHINDTVFALDGGLGLDVKETSEMFDHSGYPTAADFRLFGLKCGLTIKQIDKILEVFCAKQSLVYDLCEASGLTKKSKRMYLRSYEDRLARLNK